MPNKESIEVSITYSDGKTSTFAIRNEHEYHGQKFFTLKQISDLFGIDQTVIRNFIYTARRKTWDKEPGYYYKRFEARNEQDRLDILESGLQWVYKEKNHLGQRKQVFYIYFARALYEVARCYAVKHGNPDAAIVWEALNTQYFHMPQMTLKVPEKKRAKAFHPVVAVADQTQYAIIDGKEEPFYIWNNQRVISSQTIAEIHGIPKAEVNRQIRKNIGRLVEGEDYFAFRNNEGRQALAEQGYPSLLGLPGAKFLCYLFTAHGYYLLCTILKDEKAWQIRKSMVEMIFKQRMPMDKMYIPIPEELQKSLDGLNSVAAVMYHAAVMFADGEKALRKYVKDQHQMAMDKINELQAKLADKDEANIHLYETLSKLHKENEGYSIDIKRLQDAQHRDNERMEQFIRSIEGQLSQMRKSFGNNSAMQPVNVPAIPQTAERLYRSEVGAKVCGLSSMSGNPHVRLFLCFARQAGLNLSTRYYHEDEYVRTVDTTFMQDEPIHTLVTRFKEAGLRHVSQYIHDHWRENLLDVKKYSNNCKGHTKGEIKALAFQFAFKDELFWARPNGFFAENLKDMSEAETNNIAEEAVQ